MGLIQGLLTVRLSNCFFRGPCRLTADKALEKAIAWAKHEGLSEDLIRSITEADLTGKREPLPVAWGECLKLSPPCKKEPCKEVSVGPLHPYKVQCSNPFMSKAWQKDRQTLDNHFSRTSTDDLHEQCGTVAGATPHEMEVEGTKVTLVCICPSGQEVFCDSSRVAGNKFKVQDVERQNKRCALKCS